MLFDSSGRIRAITQGEWSLPDFINVWSCSTQGCSDSFITLFESSERILAITQGEWNLPDDSIINVPFYYAVGKYIMS